MNCESETQDDTDTVNGTAQNGNEEAMHSSLEHQASWKVVNPHVIHLHSLPTQWPPVDVQEVTDKTLGLHPFTRPVYSWQIRHRKKGVKYHASFYYVWLKTDKYGVPLLVGYHRDAYNEDLWDGTSTIREIVYVAGTFDTSDALALPPERTTTPIILGCGLCEQQGRSNHMLIDERTNMVLVVDERTQKDVFCGIFKYGQRTQRTFTSPYKQRTATCLTLMPYELKVEESAPTTDMTFWAPNYDVKSAGENLSSIDEMYYVEFTSEKTVASVLLVTNKKHTTPDRSTIMIAVDESRRKRFGLYTWTLPNIRKHHVEHSKSAEYIRYRHNPPALGGTCEPLPTKMQLCPVDVSRSCVWPGKQWSYSLRQDYVRTRDKSKPKSKPIMIPNTDAWVWWQDGRVLATALHHKHDINKQPFMIAIMRFKYKCDNEGVVRAKLVKFDTILIDQSSVPRPLVNDADWPPCLIGHNGRWLIFNVVPGQQKYAALKCLWQQKCQEELNLNDWKFLNFAKNTEPNSPIAQQWMTTGGYLCKREARKRDKHTLTRTNLSPDKL